MNDRELANDPARTSLVDHPLLRLLADQTLRKEDLGLVLGQYWRPIHYFTDFLALSIAVVNQTQLKSALSLILFQELGSGDAAQAHERLYLNAAVAAGYSVAALIEATDLPATSALMAEYRAAASSQPSAIGYLYATEVIDLTLVRSLGAALKRHVDVPELEWSRVHEVQERDHVDSATQILTSIPSDQLGPVLQHARAAWSRWAAFCDDILFRIKGVSQR